MTAILERHSLVCKPADQPDEARPFVDGKGKMQIYELGGLQHPHTTFW